MPDDPSDSKPINTDPFSFKDILDEQNEDEFYFDIYDDLFNTDYKYSDVTSSSTQFIKTIFLARLRTIEQDSIRVYWSRKDSTQKDPSLLNYDKDIDLTVRNYTITIIDSIILDKEYTTSYTGEAIFKLRYDTKQRWQILKWEDRNTTIGNPGKPYFHPEF